MSRICWIWCFPSFVSGSDVSRETSEQRGSAASPDPFARTGPVLDRRARNSTTPQSIALISVDEPLYISIIERFYGTSHVENTESAIVLVPLPKLMSLPKSLAAPATWSIAATKIEFRVPLTGLNGPQTGLWLRGRCHPDRAGEDLTFQIEYDHQETQSTCTCPLTRIDWRPRASHTNKNIGPLHLRGKSISGSHIHPFAENWDHATNYGQSFSAEAFKTMNLPIAERLDPDPNDISGAIAVMAEKFHILNADVMIPHPPWQPEGCYNDG